MLMDDFERGIERLIGNWGEKAISPGLIRELKNRYFIRDARIWDQMITLVLDRCKYSPKMVNFKEALEGMRNEVARHSDHAAGRFCGNCMKGFIEKYILSRGMPYTIMVACSCHPCPPRYENEFAGDRIPITKEQYQEAWIEFRARRQEEENQPSSTTPQAPPPSYTAKPPPPDCSDDDERKAVQEIEQEEEVRSTPPASW